MQLLLFVSRLLSVPKDFRAEPVDSQVEERMPEGVRVKKWGERGEKDVDIVGWAGRWERGWERERLDSVDESTMGGGGEEEGADGTRDDHHHDDDGGGNRNRNRDRDRHHDDNATTTTTTTAMRTEGREEGVELTVIRREVVL